MNLEPIFCRAMLISITFIAVTDLSLNFGLAISWEALVESNTLT